MQFLTPFVSNGTTRENFQHLRKFFNDKDALHMKFKDELIKTALIFSKLEEISLYSFVFLGLRDFRYLGFVTHELFTSQHCLILTSATVTDSN
jgi:hypothetical protein